MNTQTNPQTKSEKIIVGEVIREAWHFVRGLKWPFFWMAIIFPAIILPLTMMILLYALKMVVPVFYSQAMVLIFTSFKFIYVFIFWYLFAILISLAVRQTISMPIVVPMAFSDCMRVKEKIFYLFLLLLCIFEITMLVNGLITYNGLIRMILQVAIFLPFIYLSLITITFALPLIIFKRCGVQYALISAYKIMNKYWLNVVICYLILSIINLICALPILEIAMIWTIPMFFTMIGVLFKKAYSLESRSNT